MEEKSQSDSINAKLLSHSDRQVKTGACMFKRSWDDFSVSMFNYGGLRKNGQSFIQHPNK